jgi:5-methylcytosine-specific restriction protein A
LRTHCVRNLKNNVSPQKALLILLTLPPVLAPRLNIIAITVLAFDCIFSGIFRQLKIGIVTITLRNTIFVYLKKLNQLEKSPFIPDQIYKRSTLHDLYGGNRQGGITPTRSHPFIFIFSGKTGAQYGYKDGWDNENIFSYTGEGQDGDMQFIRGNLALKDHLDNGKRVFLFEYEKTAYVKFICELDFFDYDYFDTPDVNGRDRIGIKFLFKRKGIYLPVSRAQLLSNFAEEDEPTYGKIIHPTVTERKRLVTSRVGQGAYRKRITHRWEYQCAVTKFNKLDVLIASHIVPWADASHEERLDVHNGILLSPTYDALFDKHLISFENNGKIMLSDRIDVDAYKKIGECGFERLEEISIYNKEFLKRHRDLII